MFHIFFIVVVKFDFLIVLRFAVFVADFNFEIRLLSQFILISFNFIKLFVISFRADSKRFGFLIKIRLVEEKIFNFLSFSVSGFR